eukprot:6162407-Pyramimonas_sp.AAC.1
MCIRDRFFSCAKGVMDQPVRLSERNMPPIGPRTLRHEHGGLAQVSPQAARSSRNPKAKGVCCTWASQISLEYRAMGAIDA